MSDTTKIRIFHASEQSLHTVLLVDVVPAGECLVVKLADHQAEVDRLRAQFNAIADERIGPAIAEVAARVFAEVVAKTMLEKANPLRTISVEEKQLLSGVANGLGMSYEQIARDYNLAPHSPAEHLHGNYGALKNHCIAAIKASGIPVDDCSFDGPDLFALMIDLTKDCAGKSFQILDLKQQFKHLKVVADCMLARLDNLDTLGHPTEKELASYRIHVGESQTVKHKPAGCKDCGSKLGHDDDAWDQCRFCNAGKPSDEANTRGAAMGKPE